jgi:hypothetical protein
MCKVSGLGRYVQRFRLPRLALAWLVTAVAALSWGGQKAQAGFVVSGQSSALAISSNLTIGPLATATLSVNSEQQSAPAAYNLSSTNTLGAMVSAGAYNLPIFGTPEVLVSGSTGFLHSAIASTVDGFANTASASGATTVDNLNLKVLSTLDIPVVSISATALTTSSSVSGTYGSLTASGTPTFVGLAIDVLGIDVTALVEASAGVVVDIAGLTGVSIGIDVVTTGGDGITTRSVTTDNIVVNFDNALTLGGTINGSLVIGQSQASLLASPVPEPASVAMMGLGLFMAGAVGFRRSRIRRDLTPTSGAAC